MAKGAKSDDPTVRYAVLIRKSQYKILRQAALDNDVSLQSMMRRAVDIVLCEIKAKENVKNGDNLDQSASSSCNINAESRDTLAALVARIRSSNNSDLVSATETVLKALLATLRGGGERGTEERQHISPKGGRTEAIDDIERLHREVHQDVESELLRHRQDRDTATTEHGDQGQADRSTGAIKRGA